MGIKLQKFHSARKIPLFGKRPLTAPSENQFLERSIFRFRTKIALSAKNSYQFLLQHVLEYKHNGYHFLKSTFKHSEPISRDKLLLKIDFLGHIIGKGYYQEDLLS